MARGHRKVIWTLQGRATLDEVISYIAQDSLTAAQGMLERALEAAESLSIMSERGRMVPELEVDTIREILIQRYRLIYEVHENSIEVLAFIHGARDFAKWHRSISEKEAG